MGTYAYVAALGGTKPRPPAHQEYTRSCPGHFINMADQTLTEKGEMILRALGGEQGVKDHYEVLEAFMDFDAVDRFCKAGKLDSIYRAKSTNGAQACRLGTEASNQAGWDWDTYARALASFYDRASYEQCANLTLRRLRRRTARLFWRGSLPPYIRPRRADLRVDLRRPDVHHRAEV